MPTPTKSAARTEMMYELEALQEDLFVHWIDKSLPDQWTGMNIDDPVTPHKTRVTLRIDSDMLTWFRKLGPGYQTRINRVLRVYWLSLLCGHIKGYPSDKVLPRLEAETLRMQAELRKKYG